MYGLGKNLLSCQILQTALENLTDYQEKLICFEKQPKLQYSY